MNEMTKIIRPLAKTDLQADFLEYFLRFTRNYKLQLSQVNAFE
jgi:hypothetical protein